MTRLQQIRYFPRTVDMW